MKPRTGYLIMSISTASILLVAIVISDSEVPYDPCLTDDDTIIEREYVFEGERFTIPIRMNEVGGYHKNFTRQFSATFSAAKYVTVDDPTIERLMSVIGPMMDGMTNEEKAEALLRFVQFNIAYETDQEHFGQPDYNMFPVETLLEGSGDCEDTSILLKTLYDYIGLDSVMISKVGHMMVGVAGDFSGNYVFKTFSFKSTRYYTVDTTSGEVIGQADNGQTMVVSDVPMLPILIIKAVIGIGLILVVWVIWSDNRRVA